MTTVLNKKLLLKSNHVYFVIGKVFIMCFDYKTDKLIYITKRRDSK
jgi:hypothetical protein